MDVTSPSILEAQGISKSSQKAIHLTGSNCIDLINITNDNPVAKKCLSNPDDCEFGISVSLWVMFTTTNEMTTETLLSTGLINQGILFQYHWTQLIVTIRSSSSMWKATLKNVTKTINEWVVVGFTWSKTANTITIMADENLKTFNVVKQPQSALPPAKTLKLGCEEGIEAGNQRYLKARVLDPSIWLWNVCDSTLLVGHMSHQLSKLADRNSQPQPTTIPVVPPDYHSGVKRYLGKSGRIYMKTRDGTQNPLYQVATQYYTLEKSTITLANKLGETQVREQPGVEIKGPDSIGKIADCLQTCPCKLDECVDGFSFSIWLSLPAQGDTVLNGSILSYGKSINIGIYGQKFYVTINATSYLFDGVQFGKTLNLAISYQNNVTMTYVNGQNQTLESLNREITLPKSVVSEDNTHYQGNIFIGDMTGASATGFGLADLVFWDRKLFDFEVHRFFGYTSEQFTMLREGTKYWTTDPWINYDMEKLSESLVGYKANTIYQLNARKDDKSSLYEVDRWGKSLCPVINRDPKDVFVLGNGVHSNPTAKSISQRSECITDTTKCKTPPNPGLTISMWLKIRSVSNTKQRIFLNSGSSPDSKGGSPDSKGISLHTNSESLLIIKVTYEDVYKIRTDSNTYKTGDWINLGLTWSPITGSKFYLNAIDFNLRRVNGDRSSTSNEADFSHHLIVGSFDEAKTVFEAKSSSQDTWEVANMTFGDVVYFDRMMEIDEYRENTGLVNANRYYQSCYYRAQGTSLIDIPYATLKYAKDKGYPIGNRGNVQWNKEVNAAVLDNGELKLAYFSGCPGVLQLCTEGISIGGWFRPKVQVTNQYFLFFKMGSESDGKNSFGLELLNGKKVRAWIKGYGKAWDATFDYQDTRGWQHYGLTFTMNSGLRVYKNGKLALKSDTHVASNDVSSTSDVRGLTVGQIYNSSASSKTSLAVEVFNVAIYTVALEEQQLPKLLGIKKSQLLLFRDADIYIPFSGLYSSIKTPKPVIHNMARDKDKYEDANAAVCTKIGSVSYANLGNITSTCLVDTTNCSSFILTMNVKISNVPYGAVILSGGGRTKGYKGLTIVKTKEAALNFIMRNKTTTMQTNSSIELGKWFQLQLIWFKDKGLQVKVNGEDKAKVINTNKTQEANDANGGNLFIGRHSDGQDIQPAAQVCVSDIMVRFFRKPTDVEAEANRLVDVTCYQDTDFQYPLRGNLSDHMGSNLASSLTVHKTSLGDFKDKCFSDPSKCATAGFTVSLWVKITDGQSGYLFSTGGAEDRGVSMKATLTDSNKYNMEVVVSDGSKRWTAKASGMLTKHIWSNVAAMWSAKTGVIIFVGGTAVAKSNLPKSSTIAEDKNGGLFVGRSQAGGADGLNGMVQSLIIWYKPVANCAFPGKSKHVLEGSCQTLTNDKTTGKCNLQPNCSTSYGELCLDATTENILVLSVSPVQINTIEKSKKVIEYVVDKVSTDSQEILSAKASVLKNIATYCELPSDFETSSGSFLNIFSNSVDEVLAKKHEQKWKSMHNTRDIDALTGLIAGLESFSLRIAKLLKAPCVWYTMKGKNFIMMSKKYQHACSRADETIAVTVDGSINKIILPNGLLSAHPSVHIGFQIFMQVHKFIPSDATAETALDPNTNSSLKFTVNTPVLTVSIQPRISTPFPDNLWVNFSLKNIVKNVYKDDKAVNSRTQSVNSDENLLLVTKMAFFDASNKAFSDKGCRITHQSNSEINGSCSHLTTFAALMQPVPADNNAVHRVVLSVITYIGIGISLICLLLFIIIIIVRKELTGERYIIHLNLCIAFFLAQVVFLLTPAVKNDINGCRAIGIMMHFFFVAGFAWLMIEALFAFYAVTAGIIDGRLKCYLPFAWGVPIIFIAVTAGIDVSAYGHGDLCWLTPQRYFIWAFLGPVLGFIAITIIICSIVACNLATPAIKKALVVDQLRSHSKQTACLLPFLLLGWVMGTILIFTPSIPVEYIFVLFNAPQGFWIFLCFGLMNPEVKAVLCRRKRNTVADSQQWESTHRKSDAPTFHSAAGNSPPPTYRSTRSLVSSSSSDMGMDPSRSAARSQRNIQTPGFYTDEAPLDQDSPVHPKYHA